MKIYILKDNCMFTIKKIKWGQMGPKAQRWQKFQPLWCLKFLPVLTKELKIVESKRYKCEYVSHDSKIYIAFAGPYKCSR
jgi:hypothetical protein